MPSFSMGGLLTTLFMDLGIELRGEVKELTRIDKYYLKNMFYLTGALNSSYAYRFHVFNKEQKKILFL